MATLPKGAKIVSAPTLPEGAKIISGNESSSTILPESMQEQYSTSQLDKLKELVSSIGRSAVKEQTLGMVDIPGEENPTASFLFGALPYAEAELITGGAATIPVLAGRAAQIAKLGSKIPRLPVLGKTLSAAVENIPSATRAFTPMATVGSLKPAENLQQRAEHGIAEGLGGVALKGLSSIGKKGLEETASVVSGVPIKTIQHIKEKGFSNIVNEANLADDALLKQKEKALGLLEKFRVNKGVDESTVQKNLADVGEKLRTAVENKISLYGEQIQDRVAEKAVKIPIDTSSQIKMIDNFIQQQTRLPAKGITPSEIAELNNIKQSIITKLENNLPQPKPSILYNKFGKIFPSKGLPSNEKAYQAIPFVDAHDLKKIIYSNINYETKGETYNDFLKRLSGSINESLKNSSTAYKLANEKAEALLKFKSQFADVLANKKPWTTIENQLKKVGKKDIGSRVQFNNISKLIKDKTIIEDLNKILDNPNYKFANELSKQLESSSIQSLAKEGTVGIPLGISEAELLRNLEKLPSFGAKEVVESLKDVGAASYFPKTAFGWPRRIGTAALGGLLRGEENWAPTVPYLKPIVQKSLGDILNPNKQYPVSP